MISKPRFKLTAEQVCSHADDFLNSGSIEELAIVAHGAAAGAGWWDEPRNEGEMIALIHSEVSEALEALRKPSMSAKILGFTAFEEELADAVIRICDMSGALDLRLREAIHAKLIHTLFRGRKRGGKGF